MTSQMPDGYRLRWYEAVDSTNTRALEAARDGEKNGLWIVARRQSEGRGSRGRGWIGQDGNLFCSLLLVEPGEPDILGELSFVFALAVRDTLCELFLERGLQAAISLKWPNDVLVDGKKISGILLESHEIAGHRIVIAGIGINCASHPENVTWPATDLRASGIEYTCDVLFARLSGNVARRLTLWDRGNGFPGMRTEWLACAMGVGEPIKAHLPDGIKVGVFEDIDEAGKLLLRSADGSKTKLSSADVFFGQWRHSGAGV